MEDERGAVEQGSSGGASAPLVSDSLPVKSLLENMGSDNQVQEAYEEGDGAEIMVEVVGSDVYVDGISAEKDGPSDLGKVEDSEGQVAERIEGSEAHIPSDAMDVANEGDGNKVKKSDLGLSDSRDEKHFTVTEEVDGSRSKSVDVKGDAVSALSSRGDVVDDGVWNPGIEAKDGSSSGVSVPNSEVTGMSPMVISEEKRTEDDGVIKDSADSETSASRGHFSSGESGCTEAVPGPSTLVVSDEKKTEDGVSKDSLDLTAPDTQKHPAEAVPDEKATLEEKAQALPLSDDSAGLAHFSSKVSAPGEEVTGPSPAAIIAEEITEVEAVDKDSSDLVNPEPLNHPAEDVLKEKADLAEAEEVLPTTGDSASHDHFSSAVSLPTEDATGPSPMVICEEAEEVLPTTGNSASHDHFSSADLPTEDATGPSPMVISEEAEEVLPTTGNSASRDHFSSVVSLPTEDVTGPSPMVISDEKRTEDGTVHNDCADLAAAEKEEKKELLPSSDNSASRDHISSVESGPTEENTGPSPVLLGEEKKSENEAVHEDASDLVAPEPLKHPAEVFLDEKPGTEVKEEVLPSSDSSASRDNIDVDSVMSHGDTKTAQGSVVGEAQLVNASSGGEPLDSGAKDERATIDGDGVKEDESVDVKEVIATESEDTVVKSEARVFDAQDQSQGCLKEDDVKLESEGRIGGVSGAGPESHDSSFVSETAEALGYAECLKNDGDLQQTHKAHENQVLSNDPSQLTDGGDTDVADKGKSIDMEIEDDVEKDEPNPTSLSCPSDKELVLADSGTSSNQPIIAVKVAAEIESQDAVISRVEGVDGGKSREKHEEIRGLDDPTENMHILEESACTNVEVENVGAVDDDTTQSCISPERTEKAELLVSSSNEDHKSREEDHEPGESNGFYSEEDIESDRTDDGEDDSELGSEGPSSETDKPKLSNEEKAKYASSLRMEQLGYLTPPGKEGYFAHSDLVWGKVRSHPWWPGQIFDPEDASEKALKYHKKDTYLVAYFGDQTFAWNDSSALKPFRSHFSRIEKQSNSETFHNAVNCALQEVERRVELGLACSCIPKDAYAEIETQFVENTGIHEEASRRRGVDQSSQASHFEPNKLLEYITGLAPRASSQADRLDLVIARAQLSAFCRFKGYRSPAEFPLPGSLLENDADTEQVSDEMAPSKKRRHIPKDGSQSTKDRNSMELVGEREYSPDAEYELAAEDLGKSVSLSTGKKRKAHDPLAEGLEKRLSVHAAKVTNSAIQTPKPSFKIGECIRRVASQLTGSTSTIKGGNDETVIDGSVVTSEQSEKQSVAVSPESLSVNEMLSQLELLAQDPKKRRRIQNNIRAFFMGFRSSIILNRRARKKKSEHTTGGSGEEFEFDDVNDSYWTDRIVQNYSEGHILHDDDSGDQNIQLAPFRAEKPVKSGRKSYSRKRFSSGISPNAATKEDENAKRRKQESSPAELILNFAERNRIPSEINLNKMFRRFGPLMESETEVDHEASCAKVIFKRGSDAEVALNSAEKFNIFGPVLVNYQIGYSPVISVKVLPLAVPQPLEDAAMML